jgi:hypothetical protein
MPISPYFQLVQHGVLQSSYNNADYGSRYTESPFASADLKSRTLLQLSRAKTSTYALSRELTVQSTCRDSQAYVSEPLSRGHCD